MSLTIDPWSFPAAEFDPEGEGKKSIVLGGGCFWCVEAVFKELNGVTDVRPGYAGGTAATADYKTVSGGRTDHAEVVEVVYDAARIGLGEILKVFFAIAHDPIEVDRQGPDVGRQYRSVRPHPISLDSVFPNGGMAINHGGWDGQEADAREARWGGSPGAEWSGGPPGAM